MREFRDCGRILTDFFANNDVLVFGRTGSGKSTILEHAQRIAPLRYVSLGNITRSVDPTTQIGLQVGHLMARGGVWPLELIAELVSPYLEQETRFVLDGVPKHVHEAEWLKIFFIESRRQPAVGVMIDAEPETVQLRLGFEDRRSRPETQKQINDRLSVYDQKMPTILSTLGPIMPILIHVQNDVTSPFDTIVNFTQQVEAING